MVDSQNEPFIARSPFLQVTCDSACQGLRSQRPLNENDTKKEKKEKTGSMDH